MFGLMEFQLPPLISDLANKLKGNRMRWTSSRMQGSRSLAEFVCYFLFFLSITLSFLRGMILERFVLGDHQKCSDC